MKIIEDLKEFKTSNDLTLLLKSRNENDLIEFKKLIYIEYNEIMNKINNVIEKRDRKKYDNLIIDNIKNAKYQRNFLISYVGRSKVFIEKEYAKTNRSNYQLVSFYCKYTKLYYGVVFNNKSKRVFNISDLKMSDNTWKKLEYEQRSFGVTNDKIMDHDCWGNIEGYRDNIKYHCPTCKGGNDYSGTHCHHCGLITIKNSIGYSFTEFFKSIINYGLYEISINQYDRVFISIPYYWNWNMSDEKILKAFKNYHTFNIIEKLNELLGDKDIISIDYDYKFN